MYAFARANSTWPQEQLIKEPTPTTLDGFGFVVALDGDHMVVGAPNASSQAGAAFAFRRGSPTPPFWDEVHTITAPNGESGDDFGASVALDGDTFAVGAFGEDSSATGVATLTADNGAIGAGAVYVFR